MKKSTSNPITMGFALIESILIKLSMQIQLIGLDVLNSTKNIYETKNL